MLKPKMQHGDDIREMTDEEYAVYLIVIDTTEAEAAEADRQATITAARDHAASLGFTDAMLAVMYPQLEGA